MLELLSGNTAAVDGNRSCCSDLHGNILAELFVAARQVNEDADLAAHVDVAGNAAFGLIADKAAQGNLLADRSRSARNEVGNLLAVDLAVIQRVKVSRIRVNDMFCNAVGKRTELFVACGKVRLAVDFNECADFCVFADVCDNSAFCSDAAGFLLSLCDAFFTQIVDCFCNIAVRSRQGLLAVHHACARLSRADLLPLQP